MQSTIDMKLCIILCSLVFLIGTALADKPSPRVQQLGPDQPTNLTPKEAPVMFRTGDTCTVNLAGDPVYYIYPWVIGDELYKAYQDPSITCDKPYPFSIENVQLPLVYLETGTVYISVDIEDVDMSDPSCPKPGTLLTITPLYEINLENNFYIITIPLDTPIAVNGPYFVGVYFGADGNPSAAAVVTDTFPTPCVGYNDWGEGYVDLDTVHNDIGEKVFPGRLIFYSSGTTGGSGGLQPAPAARIVNPAALQSLGSVVDLWADDAAGSEIIDLTRFQFSSGGSWFDIGFDNVDDPPLRNGVDPSGFGDGLSYRWVTMGVSEGNYQLRAIVSDTLGRADTAEINVRIDPTPPIPEIVNPVFGQNICNGTAVAAVCDDEDITYMSFEVMAVPRDNALPIPAISQQIGGDINGNPADGNPVAGGEYGDYCSGPAAAAMAVKYWFNKGYNYLMTEGSNILTDTQLVGRMFTGMNIRDNNGAYDEQLISGIQNYVLTHGNQMKLNLLRHPSLNDLYTWMYDYQYCVLVGMSGYPGFWMTAAGSIAFADSIGQFLVRMADPKTGAISSFTVKEEGDKAYLSYGGNWHEIDILVGTIGYDWTVTRTSVGVDAVAADGWGFNWQASGYSNDSLYILRVTAFDNAGHNGHTSVALQVDCTVNGIAGDINHDGIVNVVDLVYMTNWLYLNGAPPAGGYHVADVNCDNLIDLADAVYLLNYLYNSGPPPCE